MLRALEAEPTPSFQLLDTGLNQLCAICVCELSEKPLSIPVGSMKPLGVTICETSHGALEQGRLAITEISLVPFPEVTYYLRDLREIDGKFCLHYGRFLGVKILERSHGV